MIPSKFKLLRRDELTEGEETDFFTIDSFLSAEMIGADSLLLFLVNMELQRQSNTTREQCIKLVWIP